MTAPEGAMLGAVGIALMAIAFGLGVVLCGLTRRWAPRFGLVDVPGGRKAHAAPTPLGGGVAIWMTTVMLLLAGGVVLGVSRTLMPLALARHADGLWSRAGELGTILAWPRSSC